MLIAVSLSRRRSPFFYQRLVIPVKGIRQPRRIAWQLDRITRAVERFSEAFTFLDQRTVKRFRKALCRGVSDFPMRADKRTGAHAEESFCPAAEARILHVLAVGPARVDKDQRRACFELTLILDKISRFDCRRLNGDQAALLE